MTDLTEWVLVPRVATVEMLRYFEGRAHHSYTAMLAISPSPPVDVAGLVLECARLRQMLERFRDDPSWRSQDNSLWPDLIYTLTHQDPTK